MFMFGKCFVHLIPISKQIGLGMLKVCLMYGVLSRGEERRIHTWLRKIYSKSLSIRDEKSRRS